MTKIYDLEDRTYQFAHRCRLIAKQTSRFSFSDYDQLIKSSGSVGANYIEANEALSKKDFVYRVKVCRKEVKESRYWLKLLSFENTTALVAEQNSLIQEATELMNIFGAIIRKIETTKESSRPGTGSVI